MVTFGVLFTALLGLAIPGDFNTLPKDSFIVSEYWRVMFGLPIVFAAAQVALLLFFFPYPTPLELKKAGNMDKLQELMGKMYPQMEIHERIEQIVIQE